MEYKQEISRNNLKATRKALGLKQKDVAKILGLNVGDRISHWERGSAIPSIINLFKLSVIYDIYPHELYGEIWKKMRFEIKDS